jgi:DHA1 family multidrug resistance protein-like MFS transporter
MVGYSVGLPFLPFIVEALGVHGPAAVALWSGFLVALLNAGNGLSAPLWGRLADRRGRKPMVIRAMTGGGVALMLCAAAPNVWVFAVLFVVLGSMAGSLAATMTLASATAPRAKVAGSFGALQSAAFVGTSLGPAVGAVLVPLVGPRPTLLVAGIFPVVSGVAVWLYVDERFSRAPREAPRRVPAHRLIRAAGLGRTVITLLLMCLLTQGALFGVIASLSLRIRAVAATDSAALFVGLAAGLQAAGAAVGALVVTRTLRRKPSQAIIGCAILGACVYAAVAATQVPALLLMLAALGGLAMGGVLPLVNTLLGEATPREIRGEVFGYAATSMAVGAAAVPVLATSLIPRWGTGAPFIMVVVVDAMLAAVALQRARGTRPDTMQPAVETTR